MDNKKLIFIIIIVILLVGGVGFWYWQSQKAGSAVPETGAPSAASLNTPPASVTQEASKSMGATIFEKTQDPLTTKLPETNPLKRIIKNPFE